MSRCQELRRASLSPKTSFVPKSGAAPLWRLRKGHVKLKVHIVSWRQYWEVSSRVVLFDSAYTNFTLNVSTLAAELHGL